MKSLLHELADAVEEAVGAFRGDAGAVTGTGAYGTPTQAIDKVAEDAVLRYLEYNGSDVNVLSEEAGFVDRGGSRTLVVDPIDGTYNAVRGLPLYATSLAVGDDRLSSVTHGLVRNLATRETYFAERGVGAFRNGAAINTRPFRSREALFSVYLGKMAEPESYEVARTSRRSRSLGAASLDLCGVACGALDLYYMKTKSDARLRVMDIAAGTLIVREAGGVVLDSDRHELEMRFTLKARTNMIAAGDRRALEALP